MKKWFLISTILFSLISTTIVYAKQQKPELYEQFYEEKGVSYCVDINSIVVSAQNNSYHFLMRTYSEKKGYQIYSCDWWPGLYSFSWYLRWRGTDKTNKRFALPVSPNYAHHNTEGNEIMGKKLPLTLWQQAITKAVEDEVILYPENTVFVYDGDKLPLLPNYPYHNGRRR